MVQTIIVSGPLSGGQISRFPVLCEAAAPSQPGEGALDDPAAREDFEALGLIGTLDDLDYPVPGFGECRSELVTGVTTISEDMAQPREALANPFEHVDGAIPVLNIGSVHEDGDQKAGSVGQDMTLAAFDLLARVISTRTAALGRFHALAIDDARPGRGFAPLDLSQVHDQQRVHHLEQSRVTPGVEIAPNRRDRWKALGQQAPGTSGRGQVEQRVGHFAHIRAATPTTVLCRGNERRHQRPLPVRHVAWIPQPFAAMLLSSNASPCH